MNKNEANSQLEFEVGESTNPHRSSTEDPKGDRKFAWARELKKIIFTKRSLQIFIGILFFVGLRVGMNLYQRETIRQSALPVHVVHPIKQSIDSNLVLPGNIEALQMASLYSHVAGYLKKIYVDEGDEVKNGQLLADIDAPDIIDEYEKDQASLKFKKVTRDRYKQLLDDRVISQQEFDSVDSAYSEESSRFEAALANMGYTHIRAPFAGSIARRYKYPGDLISSASKGDQNPIFLLVNESELRVAINVPQSDLAHVKIGSPVDLRVDTFPDRIFKGTVSRLDNLLQSSTKTQRVLIDIENVEKQLHAGMFGSVTMHFDHRDDALTIPSSAIETEGDKQFVFVVEDKKAKKIPVEMGLTQGEQVEVTSGLSTSSVVILKGTTPPSDGVKVDVVASDNK